MPPLAVDSIGVSRTITIDGTCCAGLPELNSLVDGRTYDSVYLIDTDLTLGSGEEIDVTGTFLMKSMITTTTPGGWVDEPFIFVESNAGISFSYASMRGHCTRMWGGIGLEDEASLNFSNSYMSDSYYGFYYDSSSTDPFYYNIAHSTFFNNRVCLTAFDVDPSTEKFLLNDNQFDSERESFLEPYAYNIGHNAGESFRMKYAVRIEGDSEIDDASFYGNDFKNGIIGLDFRSSAQNDVSITDCTFEGHLLVGFYGHKILVFEPGDNFDINIPTKLDTSNYQYKKVKAEDYPLITDTAVFGVFIDTVRDIEIISGKFYQDPDVLDYDFSDVKRVGIYANHYVATAWNGTNFKVRISDFKGLHIGIDMQGLLEHFIVNENLFRDNQVSIHIDTDTSLTLEPGLECNSFEQTSNTEDYDCWGLYVESDVDMEDIGGNTTGSAPGFPAGNRWPVDTANSTGYPTGTGTTPVDVTLWTAASNWYSLYESGASTPSFKYYRYENEFVGEDDGAESPSGIVVVATGVSGSSNTCGSYLDIPFPTSALGGFDEVIQNGLSIYPNPANSYLYIEHERLNKVELFDLVGQRYRSLEVSNSGKMELTIGNLPSGIYLLKISLHGTETIFEKVKIE